MELIGNRSFTLTSGNGKRSRLRRLTNGVPRGSVLAPLLFNIYISDLPNTVSRKYAYADDLAIMHADGDWQAVKGVLSKDMVTISEYLQTSKLNLSTTKRVSAVFHLNNKEAKRELKINHNNETLPFCSEHKYLRAGLPNLFSVAGHFHMWKFIAGHKRFLWCNKSLDFDKFYAITRGDDESYSCTQCCQLVWL